MVKNNHGAERDVIGQQEILVDGNLRNVISLCFQFASKIEDFAFIARQFDGGDVQFTANAVQAVFKTW